jgi:hypothetical protein
MQREIDIINPDKQKICAELFLEILTKVEQHYAPQDNFSARMENVGSKKETSPVFLSDFVEKNKLEVIRTIDFTESSTQKTVHLKQLKVHQQFIGNLCGYHTLFNLKTVLGALSQQNVEAPFDILDAAKFWDYHFKSTVTLDKHAETNKLNREKYPWSYRNIRWGDLERSFMKVLTEQNLEFQNLFQSNKKIKATYDVFQFQFGRILYGNDWLEIFERDLADFANTKDKNVHHIKFILMGITNHWSVLLAHKYNDKTEFWLLDSKNLDYLLWNKEKIMEYLNMRNEEKKKYGQPLMNTFQLWVAENSYEDHQTTVKLLVDCMLGNTTLKHFIAHVHANDLKKNFFETFCLGLEWNESNIMQHLKEQLTRFLAEESKEIYPKVEEYITGYMGSIKWMMEPQHALMLTKEALKIVAEILKAFYKLIQIHGKNSKNRFIHAFKQQYLVFEQIKVN